MRIIIWDEILDFGISGQDRLRQSGLCIRAATISLSRQTEAEVQAAFFRWDSLSMAYESDLLRIFLKVLSIFVIVYIIET